MKKISISLGYNCDPRINIKNTLMSKKDGYKTCPFDLCITPFHSLCECIETDFRYFLDDLRLIPGGNADGDRTNCGEGKQNITNHYNMIFNHEGSTHSHLFNEGKNDDLFYIRNDFEEFKKRYSKRIENYNKYISECDDITFLYKKDPYDDDASFDYEKLFTLLKKKYNNKNIILNVM